MIAQREIKPGARLVQQTLAKKLGTSAMPVIEALRRLERDGLVTHIPHLGSFVREATVEDVCESYCVRRALETEAARMFVQRAGNEEKQALRDINDRMNHLAATGDIEAFIAADLEFHMHLVKGSRVARLVEIIETRHLEEKVFQSAPELQVRGPIDHLIGVHNPIVDAINRGDASAAANAVWEHISEAERQYVQVVRELQSKVKQ